jgi:RNA recognition motif-containing protein
MKLKHIIDYFSEFGEVCYLRPDKRRSNLGYFCYSYLHRGCGFIQFTNLDDKKNVLKIKNHCIEGKYFEVQGALTSNQKKKKEA